MSWCVEFLDGVEAFEVVGAVFGQKLLLVGVSEELDSRKVCLRLPGGPSSTYPLFADASRVHDRTGRQVGVDQERVDVKRNRDQKHHQRVFRPVKQQELLDIYPL